MLYILFPLLGSFAPQIHSPPSISFHLPLLSFSFSFSFSLIIYIYILFNPLLRCLFSFSSRLSFHDLRPGSSFLSSLLQDFTSFLAYFLEQFHSERIPIRIS
ncbi:hypothetical protein SDJN03_00089, partial [Cucurbita argyrosperma subsp. sororia]